MALQTITRTLVMDVDLPPENLPESDGIPMESDWHRLAMWLLIDVTSYHLRAREDYFVGGNMFIYYNVQESGKLDALGPDYFLVWDVPLNPPRRVWAVFREGGHYPDVITELLSPSTAKEDRSKKKDIYERIFRTAEYFLYDPDAQALEGWHLRNAHYEAITPDSRGWLWSNQLGLWLGLWSGKYLRKEGTFPRFYDKQGQVVPTWAEAAQSNAEAAQSLAQAAQQHAQAAQENLEQERQRAQAAEAELTRLKELLARQNPNGQ